MRDRDRDDDGVSYDGEVRWSEDEGGSWDTFLATLRARGRARATLAAHVLLPDGGVATESRSRYAAILKPD